MMTSTRSVRSCVPACWWGAPMTSLDPDLWRPGAARWLAARCRRTRRS
jgi:hypothetical protein